MNTPVLDKAQVRAHCEQLAVDAAAHRFELDRADRLQAELATDSLLERVRRTGTGECAMAAGDEPPRVTIPGRTLLGACAAGAVLWLLIIKLVGWLL